ncbi:isoprenylcysteine carboxylmethyltransferase family protein [Edaphobacter paludis]|uniref:Isoprenylcysteine carboxylmethyltransferase family protein n=1 Tax=Edaphobacter paludis TaxID=3035702 RepID=A0AAU7CZY6_9BACT
MPIYGYLIVAVGWLVWFIPFPLNGWNRNPPQRRDRRARWGVLLQVLSYLLLSLGHFWTRSPAMWQSGLAIVLFGFAALLSWTSTRALGRHLRFEAALSPDHVLVRSGPYRLLRHPIYTSMFCLLLGTGFMVGSPLLLGLAIVIFLIGTEIRVHVEDSLLASRFGDQFRNYQHGVSAYIPLIR